MKSLLRATWALYVGHVLTFLRSRTAVYWTFAFPLFFLLMFGFAFGRGSKENLDQLMPGLFTITVISGSLFGVSLRMVSERESGILRRHRLTPVHPLAIVLAHGALALTTLGLSLLIQAGVAVAAFGFESKGNLAVLGFVMFLGGLALVPLGLVVGSVARDSKVAPAMTNFMFFPLMFLSGAAIPFQLLPRWMQAMARLVPTTYLVDALRGVIVWGVGVMNLKTDIAMLLLTAIIGVCANGLLFRWESTEPVRARRLAIAILVLGILYVTAFVLSPALHVAATPGT
jgi:ABC-2 type transport system permease protein